MGSQRRTFNPEGEVGEGSQGPKSSTRQGAPRLSCAGQGGDIVRKTMGEERGVSKDNWAARCVQGIRDDAGTEGAEELVEELRDEFKRSGGTRLWRA